MSSKKKGLKLSYSIISQNETNHRLGEDITTQIVTLKSALPLLERKGKRDEIQRIEQVLINFEIERNRLIGDLSKERFF